MAEEETKNDEETADAASAGSDPVSDETAEAAPAGSDPVADETAEPAADAGSDPSSDDAAADDEPAAPAADEGSAPSSGDSEAEAPLTEKQKRKLERSTHTGEPSPPRTPEERAAERAEGRKRAAANRRRYRQRTRARRGEAKQGTPPAAREPGTRKVRQGMVVSAKADKTITVRIDVVRRHPQYEKVVRRSTTLHAHDADNQAQEGDTVRVVETRPLSRTKRWRLVEVVEKAR